MMVRVPSNGSITPMPGESSVGLRNFCESRPGALPIVQARIKFKGQSNSLAENQDPVRRFSFSAVRGAARQRRSLVN
jgi:hypothetical protein